MKYFKIQCNKCLSAEAGQYVIFYYKRKNSAQVDKISEKQYHTASEALQDVPAGPILMK